MADLDFDVFEGLDLSPSPSPPSSQDPLQAPEGVLAWTVEMARRWVYDHLDETYGVTCPCCGQKAKRYHRKFPSATARVLIAILRRHGQDWLHVPGFVAEHLPQVAGQGGYAGPMARHWGLLETDDGLRPDGSDRTGWYRITDRGRLFVRGHVTVPKYVLLYNDTSHGHEGVEINIQEALGNAFHYDELMEGR